MTPSPLPLSKDLVLIGGGHSHALLLRKWGMAPLAGARLTVINPGPTAPYSGMLPGHLAGHYTRDALDIDLVKLARFAGARLILGAVDGIDLKQRQIHVPDRPPIGFDVASIDVGITSEMPNLVGFADHAVPAKPLDTFAQSWAAYRAGDGPASIAVIGGGVAGAEIAMAFAHAMRRDRRSATIHLIDRGAVLAALPHRSARRLRDAMGALGITLVENARIAQIRAGTIVMKDAPDIHAAFITGAAGAQPHGWLAQSGLDLHEGFITVNPFMQSSDPAIFATGDCAHMQFAPRPKAGVYAVRQAPILFDNLRTALRGTQKMRAYKPQKDYLKLISLGHKSALADRYGMTFSGPLLWRWKDHIDRTFMDQFRDLPQMDQPALPKERASGSVEALGDKPFCGGCGSKVGRGALATALSSLPAHTRADVEQIPGDDAAVLKFGTHRQVISTDHLRALVDDPVMMVRIAAIHALGDIWSMGAVPQGATANLILPRMSPALAERSLTEIMQATQRLLAQNGAALLGGHSSLGSEWSFGFTVTGLCETAPISTAGAQVGDALILTKPLGSGVIMAAEMAKVARGADVMAALAQMQQPQGRASTILAQAGTRAMTDVTGFGLAGHLLNICEASQVGAKLWPARVPLMQGALDLARAGIRSTLFPENRALLPHSGAHSELPHAGAHPELPHAGGQPETDLMFDPQTAGGLLAALPGDPAPVLAALQDAGYHAAHIGQITDQAGQITFD
jgi:selenide,water dikinase